MLVNPPARRVLIGRSRRLSGWCCDRVSLGRLAPTSAKSISGGTVTCGRGRLGRWLVGVSAGRVMGIVVDVGLTSSGASHSLETCPSVSPLLEPSGAITKQLRNMAATRPGSTSLVSPRSKHRNVECNSRRAAGVRIVGCEKCCVARSTRRSPPSMACGVVCRSARGMGLVIS
jgi:hypothetical protein